MALYFLHLRNSQDECLDPEGKEFDNLEELRSAVLISARDLMAGDLRNGIIDLRFRIDAENERGEVVHSLPFKQAFRIIQEDA